MATAPVCPARASDVEYSGIARAVDGDTLVISLKGGQQKRVRLYGVDAPETKQLCQQNGADWPCGAASTDVLRAVIEGAEGAVHCVVLNVDRFGRDVAVCDARRQDLSAAMVRSGWALAYREYGGAALDGAEEAARSARVGLWRTGNVVQPPWEWRRERN